MCSSICISNLFKNMNIGSWKTSENRGKKREAKRKNSHWNMQRDNANNGSCVMFGRYGQFRKSQKCLYYKYVKLAHLYTNLHSKTVYFPFVTHIFPWFCYVFFPSTWLFCVCCSLTKNVLLLLWYDRAT